MWKLTSSVLFAVMGILVKIASANVTAAELLFYRSLLGLLITYALFSSNGAKLKTLHWRKHVLRGILGFAAMMSFFTAITLLPIATAVTLNFTSPIFLTLVTLVLHRDRMSWDGYLAIAIGFVGVAFLLRPSFSDNDLVGEMLGLGSGVMAGIAAYHIRQLGKMGEPSSRIVFYFMLVCSLCSGTWMSISGVSEIFWKDALLILGVGLLGTGAQLAMTRAYSISHSVAVSSLAYANVLFTCLFGVLFFGDTFEMIGWIGIALIIVGGTLASYSNRSRSSAA